MDQLMLTSDEGKQLQLSIKHRSYLTALQAHSLASILDGYAYSRNLTKAERLQKVSC